MVIHERVLDSQREGGKFLEWTMIHVALLLLFRIDAGEGVAQDRNAADPEVVKIGTAATLVKRDAGVFLEKEDDLIASTKGKSSPKTAP